MRLLRVHSTGTDESLARRIGDAVAEFNRKLDIRLRFLSILIEDDVVEVDDAAAALEAVEQSLSDRQADVVLLMGEGDAAVAAATAANRAGRLLLRMSAGEREGAHADANRAVDRLSSAHLHHGAEAALVLETEGIDGLHIDVGDVTDTDVGDRIVRAIGRARRGAQGGN